MKSAPADGRRDSGEVPERRKVTATLRARLGRRRRDQLDLGSMLHMFTIFGDFNQFFGGKKTWRFS
jgi:hypothetical protein